MAKEKILVIDDEEDILELIKFNLEREGFEIECVGSGEEGGQPAKTDQPSVDSAGSDAAGHKWIGCMPKTKQDPAAAALPIIIISAKGEDADVVAGLELGADDYVTKPFSPRVLLARVRAVLRRKAQAVEPRAEARFQIHELVIDSERHEVLLAGQPVALSPTEFRILRLLAASPGRVFTRSQIVEGVHGDDYPVTDRSIDVQIVGLRKKLSSFDQYIETIRGVGYRFKE